MAEITLPRRRWFQFSLATMFVLVAMGAFGTWQYSSWVRGKVGVNIATTGDIATADAMTAELLNYGIESGSHGSIAWALTVRRRDAARARAILLKAPSLKPYQFTVIFQDWELGKACPPLQ